MSRLSKHSASTIYVVYTMVVTNIDHSSTWVKWAISDIATIDEEQMRISEICLYQMTY